MHAQELVVTHALGLRERSKQGVVTDKFESGKTLRNRVKNLLSKKWTRKQKVSSKSTKQFVTSIYIATVKNLKFRMTLEYLEYTECTNRRYGPKK
jgi:hypothetical protein